MNKALLVFPNQLFEAEHLPPRDTVLFLVEEPLFFNHVKFHKQKLVFLRAAFKSYETNLRRLGYDLKYIPFHEFSGWKKFFQTHVVQAWSYWFTDDYLLEKRIHAASKEMGFRVSMKENPLFISPLGETIALLSRNNKPLMATFYNEQRKKTGVLMDVGGKPLGGKWSFDGENRKKIPAGMVLPSPMPENSTLAVEEAKKYVTQHFDDHPGSFSNFLYPVTHDQARRWFDTFLEERFRHFGTYEDAMVSNHNSLYHSLISPLLNVGLLNPNWVVNRLLQYAVENDIAINNTEGFVRQIIGWREFMRGVYHLFGSKQRNSNFFGNDRDLDERFYIGKSGILPLDLMVDRLHHSAYNHHIERLMVAGNWMLLAGVHPHAAYRWFMEMYIDAWDWVMVPNVYGMSQYADGGLVTTKPYVSGSNYILKMSDYKKGNWSNDWDALYWSFIGRNLETFKKNPRMSMMCRLYEKQSAEKRAAFADRAELIRGNLPLFREDEAIMAKF